jgi:hypothetical protein
VYAVLRDLRVDRGGTAVISLEGSGGEPSHDGFSDSEGEDGEEGDAYDDDLDDENFFSDGAAALTNYGAILLGDPQFDPSEPDCPPELVRLSTNLVNFALFCGYTNLHMSETPHDSSLDYSLRLDDLRGEHLQAQKAAMMSGCRVRSLFPAQRTAWTPSAKPPWRLMKPLRACCPLVRSILRQS